MRIFCGLTGDATTIAAAVVNERGGVIATTEVTDDAFGYLALCRMWARHADIAHVALADHGDTRALVRLGAAAGQPTSSAETVDVNSDDPLDKAVHIARMFARGELATRSASEESPPVRQLVGGLNTLALNAHQGHGSLIELLRQVHPAALAAWGDPTETAALEVLRTSLNTSAPGSSTTGGRAEPKRVKELALALERTQRVRDYQLQPHVATAVAAAAEALLGSERACFALANGLEDAMSVAAETAPAKAAPAPSTRRARRSASERATTQAPTRRSAGDPATSESPAVPRERQRPEPLPSRVQTHDDDLEPVTAPLHPRSERGQTEPDGFPVMPEPPQFVEPAAPARQPAAPRPPRPQRAEPKTEPDLLSTSVDELSAGFDFDDADDDLLIFSQARSAWFKGPAAIEDSEEAWNFEADEGWRAAEAANDNLNNQATETTSSGLPRRVPQANLVPGSAILSDAKPLPIKRDATALASRTAGFFRGWSRARRETVGAGTGS